MIPKWLWYFNRHLSYVCFGGLILTLAVSILFLLGYLVGIPIAYKVWGFLDWFYSWVAIGMLALLAASSKIVLFYSYEKEGGDSE